VVDVELPYDVFVAVVVEVEAADDVDELPPAVLDVDFDVEEEVLLLLLLFEACASR
jgi:hypothetical protein